MTRYKVSKKAKASAIALTLLLPLCSFGSTVYVDRNAPLTAAQKQLLANQVSEAASRCQTTPEHLSAKINLVVDQIFPTSGIPLTAEIAVFLESQGMQSARLQESQVERARLGASFPAAESTGSHNRTVQVSIACGQGS